MCSYPCGSDGKESTCNEGNVGSIPGSERSPGEGNGNPLQYSCLGNLMNRRSLAGYSPWGQKESDMPEHMTHICLPKKGCIKHSFQQHVFSKVYHVSSIVNYIYIYNNYRYIYDNIDKYTIYFFYMNWTILSYFPNLLLVGLKLIYNFSMQSFSLITDYAPLNIFI